MRDAPSLAVQGVRTAVRVDNMVTALFYTKSPMGALCKVMECEIPQVAQYWMVQLFERPQVATLEDVMNRPQKKGKVARFQLMTRFATGEAAYILVEETV